MTTENEHNETLDTPGTTQGETVPLDALKKEIEALRADMVKSKTWILGMFKRMYALSKSNEVHTHNSHGTAVIPASKAEALLDAGEEIGREHNAKTDKAPDPRA